MQGFDAISLQNSRNRAPMLLTKKTNALKIYGERDVVVARRGTLLEFEDKSVVNNRM
jgi:hypothetical protein